MELFLVEDVWSKIEDISEEYYPEEACGLLIGERLEDTITVKELRETDNVFSSSKAYKIEPELVVSVLEELEEKEEELVGFFHSHPKMAPYVSSRDKKFTKLWLDKTWIIAATDSNGKVREVKGYRSVDEEIEEIKIKRE